MQGQLVINEVVSGNTEFSDNFGQTPDWIELKNVGASEIELDLYYLSDDAANLFKWNLPNTNLDPEDLVVVFGTADSTDQFHFTFGIGLNGEQLFLSHIDDGLVQNILVPSLQQNHSFGIPQGQADFRFFDSPTPNGNNSTVNFLGYAPSPTLSHAAGHYEDQFELIIFPPFSGGQIHYTLDGSPPTAASPQYEDPLIVDSLHVVKSAFFQDGWLPSASKYATYFVNINHNLPIVSLSCANDSLFDPIVGLYMDGPNVEKEWPYFGANYWAEREIPISFEYFENGDLKFSQEVGLQIHGGKSSRTKTQKPLRLTARSQFGSDFMEYAFFDHKPGVNKFRHLVLRNSGADFLKTNFRDGYWHQLALEERLDFEAFGFKPAIVYINGEYWGIMSIREKVSEFYCSENSQANADSVIIGQIENQPFVGDTIHYFNLSQFIINQDLSIESNFTYVSSQLDIQSYQDYFAFEIFAGNPDWPANNIKFWKPAALSGKWRYILFDLDTTMGLTNWLTSDWDMFDWIYNEKSAALNSRIFINLLENDEFRRQFINRIADLMNTKLNTESLQAYFKDVIETFNPEIERHYDRWNGDMDLWTEHTENRVPNFMIDRHPFVQDQIVNQFDFNQKVNLTFECFPSDAGTIQINTLGPRNFFEGVYFSGNPIDIAIQENSGFEFDHWAFSEHWLDHPNAISMQQDFLESGTLTAVFKYRHEESLFTTGNTGEENTFQFVYQAREKTEYQVQVTNSSGKVVLGGTKFMEAGKNFFTLDLSEESTGIYIVQVISASTKAALTLFVP
ncbi:MAG: hypothetical protein ACI84C_002250 [Flavobacteriales bacterium]|jgi:hypothetical protein